MAAKVLLEYSQLNGLEAGKRGVKRKCLDLTQYEYSRSGFQSNAEESASPLWDEELFLNQMRSLRGWNVSQAAIKWKSLLADDMVDKDHGGPDGSVRCRIASNLLGNDLLRKQKGEEERRSLKTSQRPHKATPEEQEAIKGELLRGFSTGLQGAGADFFTPVAPSSATATWASNKEASERLLLENAGMTADKKVTRADGQEGSVKEELSPGQASKSQTGLPQSSAHSGQSPGVNRDVALERNKLATSLVAVLETERQKLIAALKASAISIHFADAAEDQDDLEVVEQRHQVAQAVLAVCSTKLAESGMQGSPK